jgi:hypothetical protein
MSHALAVVSTQAWEGSSKKEKETYTPMQAMSIGGDYLPPITPSQSSARGEGRSRRRKHPRVSHDLTGTTRISTRV